MANQERFYDADSQKSGTPQGDPADWGGELLGIMDGYIQSKSMPKIAEEVSGAAIMEALLKVDGIGVEPKSTPKAVHKKAILEIGAWLGRLMAEEFPKHPAVENGSDEVGGVLGAAAGIGGTLCSRLSKLGRADGLTDEEIRQATGTMQDMMRKKPDKHQSGSQDSESSGPIQNMRKLDGHQTRPKVNGSSESNQQNNNEFLETLIGKVELTELEQVTLDKKMFDRLNPITRAVASMLGVESLKASRTLDGFDVEVGFQAPYDFKSDIKIKDGGADPPVLESVSVGPKVRFELVWGKDANGRRDGSLQVNSIEGLGATVSNFRPFPEARLKALKGLKIEGHPAVTDLTINPGQQESEAHAYGGVHKIELDNQAILKLGKVFMRDLDKLLPGIVK